MKKLTLLAALAALLVGIVGCADEGNATEENATPATTDAGTPE